MVSYMYKVAKKYLLKQLKESFKESFLVSFKTQPSLRYTLHTLIYYFTSFEH